MVRRLLIAACVAAPIALAGLYASNPMGARSLDARERVLGIGLYRIPSEAMAPTLMPGDIVVVRAGDAAVASLRRGDLVVFTPPHHPDQVWIKRVIALPGDTVELRDRVVVLNGRAQREPWVDPRRDVSPYGRDTAPQRVPAGRIFVLGDNRDNSEDSRYWGYAMLDAVRGRVIR
jgi:signal peptidase I